MRSENRVLKMYETGKNFFSDKIGKYRATLANRKVYIRKVDETGFNSIFNMDGINLVLLLTHP